MVALSGFVVWPREAAALPEALSTPAPSCGYPMMVGINGATCQGTYVGGGLVVTAAHCVDEASENPATIFFGDGSTYSYVEYEFKDVECRLHATWDDTAEEGVDLATCHIDPFLVGTAPNVPVVYPTPPDGCEVEYLRHVLKWYSSCDSQDAPDCRDGIPGVHVSAGPTGTSSGQKRYTDSVVVRQEDKFDSPFMLYTSVFDSNDPNTQAGDSGAPLYMQMPDDSWRLLGVHVVRYAGKAYTQAVPPYYKWIEDVFSDAGVSHDLLPCHALAPLVDWTYDNGPNCENQLNLAVDAPNATWASDCQNSGDLGGGHDECGGWTQGIIRPPDPKWKQPSIDPMPYGGILADVQGDVGAGLVPCNLDTIEDEIIARGEYYAGWLYLADAAPRGWLGLYSEAAVDARAIYNACI